MTVLTLAYITICFGQAFDWADSLNTAKDVAYLTPVEKEIIHELNKVRSNPQQYVRYIKEERTYYQGKKIKKPGAVTMMTVEGVAAVDECIAALEKAEPVGILYPHGGLTASATDLAVEQSRSGATAHTSGDGSSMESRVRRHVKQFTALGETLHYGRGDSRTIVISLLIDDGVASRGHRVIMLNPTFDCCGVAIDRHPVYRQVCVIDFGKLNTK
jgi:uncharacterized protein YkwD